MSRLADSKQRVEVFHLLRLPRGQYKLPHNLTGRLHPEYVHMGCFLLPDGVDAALIPAAV